MAEKIENYTKIYKSNDFWSGHPWHFLWPKCPSFIMTFFFWGQDEQTGQTQVYNPVHYLPEYEMFFDDGFYSSITPHISVQGLTRELLNILYVDHQPFTLRFTSIFCLNINRKLFYFNHAINV